MPIKKHKLFWVILALLPLGVWGQSNDLKWIGPAHGHVTGQQLQIDWALGEIAIHTQFLPDVILTEGFLQPSLSFLNSPNSKTWPLFSEGAIRVLPNPSTDFFYLELGFRAEMAGFICTDVNGRVFAQSKISTDVNRVSLNARTWPVGTYSITFWSNGPDQKQSFLLQKI